MSVPFSIIMFSQQSAHKIINNIPKTNLPIRDRWIQVAIVFIGMFCLVVTEESIVVETPCTGSQAENCSSGCNVTCAVSECNNGTGECKNNTKEEQYQKAGEEPGVPLIQERHCKDGMTGSECNLVCSEKCVGRTCDPVTGDCLGGCVDGYHGPRCVEGKTLSATQASPCKDGVYGANCSLDCPENCVSCDHVTGDCNSSCRSGYRGPNCDQACPAGYYGDKCENQCPNNCANNECHHESGYCLKGCKEHYWGSDCSLIGEFKDNPEPAQDKFYTHLSAESKSVLLYLLMGQYEEQLEKAQQEINRGRQLRNKLRDLMSD